MCIPRINPLAAAPQASGMQQEALCLSYKVHACTKTYRHDWGSCPFVHKGEMSARRSPSQHLPILCRSSVHSTDLKEKCPLGANCPFAHNHFEYWLHPGRYRTSMCRNAGTCKRAICFFAHSDEQLRRTIYSCMPGEDVDTPAAASEHTVAAAAAEAAGMVNASDACLSCVTGFLLGLQRGGQDIMAALLTSQFPGAEEAAARAAAKAAAAAGASSRAGSVSDGSDASAAPGTPPAADAPPATAAASSNGSAAPSPVSARARGQSEVGSPSSAAAGVADGAEEGSGVLCCMCHGPMVTSMKAAKAPAGLPSSAADAWGGRGSMEQAHVLGALGMLPEEVPPYMRDMLYMNGGGDGSELMYQGVAALNGGGSMMQHIMLQRQMAAAQQFNYMQSMGMAPGAGAGGYGASAAAAAAAEDMRHQMLLQQLRGPAARGKENGWGGVTPAAPPANPMGVGHELGMGGATLTPNELTLLNAAAMGGNQSAVLQQQQLAAAAAAAGGYTALPMQPAATGGIQLADLQAALEMLATPMSSGMAVNGTAASMAAAMQGTDLSNGLVVGGVGPASAAAGVGLVGQQLAMQPQALGLAAAAGAGGQMMPLASHVSGFAAQAASMSMLAAQDHMSARPAGPPAMLATMQAQQQQAQAAAAAAAAAQQQQQQAARNWHGWQPQRSNLADAQLLQGPARVQAVDNWWEGCGAGHELGL